MGKKGNCGHLESWKAVVNKIITGVVERTNMTQGDT